MTDLSSLLLYVPGIVIFLVGSGQVHKVLSIQRAVRNKKVFDGNVLAAEHIVKKDKKGNKTFDYYNITVEFTNASGHKERHAVKSPSQYAVGQQIYVMLENSGTAGYTILENDQTFIFNPWVVMIIGALCIMLALWQNQGKEVYAMAALSAMLIVIGGALIWDFVSMKRRSLTALEGEIADVYTRQISRGTKIIKGDKFTYYPIVKYVLDGKENFRKCNLNSGNVQSFKVGDPYTLYLDQTNGKVIERKANALIMAAGIVILVLGIMAGLSILSVV